MVADELIVGIVPFSGYDADESAPRHGAAFHLSGQGSGITFTEIVILVTVQLSTVADGEMTEAMLPIG